MFVIIPIAIEMADLPAVRVAGSGGPAAQACPRMPALVTDRAS